MGAVDTTDLERRRRFRWLVVAVSVSATVVAGTVAGVGSPIAATIGVLVALGTIGWTLWRAAPDPQQARSNLGTGLLVSIVVAGAVGSAQLTIDERRRVIELERQQAGQRAADRLSLSTTVGLQKSLVGLDLGARDLTRFYFADKNLRQASFEHATLVRANFERANLRDAGFRRADLRLAGLYAADLRGAILAGADLGDAEVSGATLRLADLTGAHLRRTDLQGACLREAFLPGADLRGADLRAADVAKADLRGADLRGANLRGADFSGAMADARTRWPAGVDRGGAGPALRLTACTAPRPSPP
jgi:uncharacterized protein YjbI with pentapeptide repeats